MTRLRVSSVLALATLAAGAAPALALPDGWSAPVTLSAARVSGLQPWAAANARGDLAVAWRARGPAGETVQVARRPAAAAAFSAPITVGPPSISVQGVRVALGANGRALVGWRTKDHGRSTVHAALIPASGSSVRITSYPGAKDASGAVNVAITPTGLAAVAWVANSRTIQNAQPGVFDGRARIALARPGGPFGPARRLNPRTRRFSVDCANESGTDIAARRDGGLMAWWDCDDDVRDFVTISAQISPAGVIARPQEAGSVSRGPSGSAIQPAAGASALGVQSVNNDDDQGPNVSAMVRSAAGAWSGTSPTIANVPVDPLALPPHILGRARIAAAGATALAAWVGDDDQVVAMTGATATATWDPATALATTGSEVQVAGVGVTAARSLQVVFTTRTAPGAARTLWSSRRLASEPAFGAPQDALHIPRLTGEAAFALGRDGRGVVVWSEGPKTAARVRAALVTVP